MSSSTADAEGEKIWVTADKRILNIF